MKILAIETTGHFASVALGSRQIKNDTDYSHLQEISPMCLEILEKEGIKGTELDAIAVSRGPGSFTGIRIGLATAKALALVWDKPVICVPTLESFAYRDDIDADTIVIPVFDARRNQVYGGIYKNRAALLAAGAYETEEFKNHIEACLRNEDPAANVKYFGDGCYLLDKQSSGVQEAKQLLELAEDMYKQGKVDTCYSAEPEYMRMAEAERKLLERQ
ncbi:MAG: tRNA (adenosine(37)-N6)-threonylcarbamoyltransferase complex dimerization subunit type 1 TsaB [Firmicutes bacterium]|nr:tRNA (adenosine(37)-N6)-threonylcarbamoyltransferase complex dimerization subunit type 1 TsaB [Bacillota bacterium]